MRALDNALRGAVQSQVCCYMQPDEKPSTVPFFSAPLDEFSAAGKSYKEQKEMERRARAGDSVGWNASFVRSDTVVDALADRLGVGKSDILDREEVSE